jgi:hypothetical protein
MTLPVPRLTATILPAPADAPRHYLRFAVIHGSPGWQRRIVATTRVANKHHCGACGSADHNSRNLRCPAWGWR